jgi:hypothetical protein
VQIAGVEHTLVCHTRDISVEGCFLDTSETIAEGVPVTLALMDNETGEAVQCDGVVARCITSGANQGIGVRLASPPGEWQSMVERYSAMEESGNAPPKQMRMAILVVGDEEHRRGALALYVTSGWDVRFAVDRNTAVEALEMVKLDAVIAEHNITDPRLAGILEAARQLQPAARRIVRCPLRGAKTPPPGRPEELVHRVVDMDSGLDALLDALTVSMD